MAVSTLRLERTSLYNYLKYEVLPVEFSEQLTESLVYNLSLGGYVTDSSMDPSPISLGRGWVPFDDFSVGSETIVDISQEQASKVTVAPSYGSDLVTDGDMEAAGVGAWTVGNNATLTKETGTPYEGSQVLRIARNGEGNPYTSQDVLTIGKKYRATGWARSDGNAVPVIHIGTNAVSWTGTISTSWQYFDVIVVTDISIVALFANTEIGTEYTEFDAVEIKEAMVYTVDYLRGAIKNPTITPTSVTYSWNYVSVLKSWPGSNPPPLPIVSIDVGGSSPEGFQLGGGKKRVREASIYIFATSPDERDDLTDTIEDSFFNRNVSVKDYSTGDYLNYDGTFNTGFSPSNISSSPMYMLDVASRPINVADIGSELNRYRSVINIVYETYTG
ncbi:MAG TPA: hypothetical protein ENI23_17850 [bacterium]|nr:hypothetical protein [bacterium]